MTADKDATPAAPQKMGIFARLRGYFLAGVLVIAPIAITVAVALWFIDMVDSQIVPLIPDHLNPDTYIREVLGVEIGLPGLGVLVLVVFITVIGAFAAGLVGRFLVRIGESILQRMPIVRSVYSGSKQILETVLKQQSDAFRQAVLVEYPRRGVWAFAFVTANTEEEVKRRLDGDMVNVYVPTTPNPTSGFLLFVPRKDMIVLDMPVEEAIKMLISMGIVTPKDRGASKVETANSDLVKKLKQEMDVKD